MCITCALIELPFFLLIIAVPESPRYLISNNEFLKAQNVLRILGRKGELMKIEREFSDLKPSNNDHDNHNQSGIKNLVYPWDKQKDTDISNMNLKKLDNKKICLLYTSPSPRD